MARTTLTVQTAPGSFPAATLLLTQNAADVSNKNQFAMQGGEYIIANNTDASDRSVTLTSAAHSPTGRTGDVTFSVVAGTMRLIAGPLATNGWQQSDGMCYLEAAHAGVKFIIFRP